VTLRTGFSAALACATWALTARVNQRAHKLAT